MVGPEAGGGVEFHCFAGTEFLSGKMRKSRRWMREVVT